EDLLFLPDPLGTHQVIHNVTMIETTSREILNNYLAKLRGVEQVPGIGTAAFYSGLSTDGSGKRLLAMLPLSSDSQATSVSDFRNVPQGDLIRTITDQNGRVLGIFVTPPDRDSKQLTLGLYQLWGPPNGGRR